MSNTYPSTMLVDFTGKTDSKAMADEVNKALHDILDKINKTNDSVPSSTSFTINGQTYQQFKDYDYSNSVTFQGFGTPTAIKFFWQRCGNRMKGMGLLTAGTTTGVEARIGLPFNLLSDKTLISSIIYAGSAASSLGIPVMCLIEPGIGYITFGLIGAVNAFVKQNGNAFMAAGGILAIQFEFPVSWQ